MIHFVSGLPRSGSTLLMNILGNNPNHYVTPTSGLIELVVGQMRGWKNIQEFQAEGLGKVKPRVKRALKGLIRGYYETELLQGKTIFDKSRGWLAHIEDLENILEREVRVITTIRDVRDIAASFEKLYRKRDIDWQAPMGDDYLNTQTIEGRMQNLLGPGGVVGITINRLRDALRRDVKNRIIVVPYYYLTNDPKFIMDNLHNALNLPLYDYDFNNIQQVTFEDDNIHGMDLHRIKNAVTPAKEKTWEGIIPEHIAEQIYLEFKDICDLAAP